jgi:hypothetical protein
MLAARLQWCTTDFSQHYLLLNSLFLEHDWLLNSICYHKIFNLARESRDKIVYHYSINLTWTATSSTSTISSQHTNTWSLCILPAYPLQMPKCPNAQSIQATSARYLETTPSLSGYPVLCNWLEHDKLFKTKKDTKPKRLRGLIHR